jgi:hypothetical protein
MKFFPVTILLIACLCGTICCIAQTNKEYLYQDSTLLYNNEEEMVEEVVADSAVAADEAAVVFTTDTTLVNNGHRLSADSVEALKRSKELAYTQSLDSLLKKLKSGQLDKADATGQSMSWIVRFFSSPITKVFFWILGGAFILFLLYRLFFAGGFFSGSTLSMDRYSNDAGEDHSTADYGKLAAEAATLKNYRLATRYLYLQALQALSNAGALVFAADKTNRQYYYELAGKPYQQQFAALTDDYEYVWYGGFEANEKQFAKIRADFNSFYTVFKT